MAPLIVLAVSFLLFRILGFLVSWFVDWQNSLRGALGAMFLITASAHWGRRRLTWSEWFLRSSAMRRTE